MQGLLLLAVVAGAGLSVQAAINARLGRELGSPVWAACASVTVSTLSLLLYALATRTTFPPLRTWAQIPAWGWLGGVFGALYVTAVILAAPRLGVAAMTGLAVGGQVTLAMLLDHYGLLGLERHPFNAVRLLGMVLLVVGVILVKRF